jgi:hypothetical protein
MDHFCIYIHVYIFSPCIIHPPIPSLPLSASNPCRTCSSLVVSDFCKRKCIRDKNRNLIFLLVWNKDNYTRRFIALFPYMYVIELQLIHFCQSMVAPDSLRFLYSFIK